MRNKFQQVLAALAIAFVLFVAENVAAQNAKRISFARGTNSATVNGAITKPNSSVKYLLGAKAGQKLMVDFEPDSGASLPVVMVFPPGKSSDKDRILDEGGGGHYEVALTDSGNYSIIVGCVKRCRYSLTVAIE